MTDKRQTIRHWHWHDKGRARDQSGHHCEIWNSRVSQTLWREQWTEQRFYRAVWSRSVSSPETLHVRFVTPVLKAAHLPCLDRLLLELPCRSQRQGLISTRSLL